MIYLSPALGDANPVRNACFLLGVMHEKNPSVMTAFIPKSLEFYMNCHSSFEEPEVKDNVVAGITRIYAVDTNNYVPQEKVSPSFISASRDCDLLLPFRG